MRTDLGVSVIIPAYNEEATIAQILREIYHKTALTLSPTFFEIIVVDDGSSDKTAEKARETKLARVYSNLRNMGKGYSMRKGVILAKGNYIAFFDADGSHLVNDLLFGIKFILENDKDNKYHSHLLITGVRFKNLFYGTTKLNALGNKLYTYLMYILWRKKITDLTCGLRILKKEVFQSLNLSSSRYTIEVEMIAKALRSRVRIVQFPIHANKRFFGKSGVRMLREGIILPASFLLASLNMFELISKRISI